MLFTSAGKKEGKKRNKKKTNENVKKKKRNETIKSRVARRADRNSYIWRVADVRKRVLHQLANRFLHKNQNHNNNNYK